LSTLLGSHVPRKQADNLSYFRKLVEGKKLGLFFGTLVYSLSPLPSNFLFIASGVSGVNLLPVIAGFAVGRFISYAFLVYASARAYESLLGFFDMKDLRLVADIPGRLNSFHRLEKDIGPQQEATPKSTSSKE